MEYLGYFASILIGISLGLIGGGGSILTIPILVYLFKINPENATSYSLFIVGITALIGSYNHYLLGNLKLKSALYFAFPSVISLLFVRDIVLPNTPNHLFFIHNFEVTKNSLIMLIFAILMIFASISMIRKSNSDKNTQEISFLQLSFIGLMVGFVNFSGCITFGNTFLIILFFSTFFIDSVCIFLNGFTAGSLFNGNTLFITLLIISGFAIVARGKVLKTGSLDSDKASATGSLSIDC